MLLAPDVMLRLRALPRWQTMTLRVGGPCRISPPLMRRDTRSRRMLELLGDNGSNRAARGNHGQRLCPRAACVGGTEVTELLGLAGQVTTGWLCPWEAATWDVAISSRGQYAWNFVVTNRVSHPVSPACRYLRPSSTFRVANRLFPIALWAEGRSNFPFPSWDATLILPFFLFLMYHTITLSCACHMVSKMHVRSIVAACLLIVNWYQSNWFFVFWFP
jgi:hypothetical protein